MANRKHVTRGRVGTAMVAIFAMSVVACSEAGPQATEFRGRVIDQDTGQPIAGAIVVGKYTGSRGFEGSTSCNRVESAVSDPDGWFTMPIDPRDGGPLMEAYHRGYKWGRSPRWAQNGRDGNPDHWQVQVVEWNAENDSRQDWSDTNQQSTALEAEAIAASRQEKDVYLKAFRGAPSDRLTELHRLPIAGSCRGTFYSSPGPVPFFEAVLQEQRELADDEASLRLVSGAIAAAQLQHARAQVRPMSFDHFGRGSLIRAMSFGVRCALAVYVPSATAYEQATHAAITREAILLSKLDPIVTNLCRSWG